VEPSVALAVEDAFAIDVKVAWVATSAGQGLLGFLVRASGGLALMVAGVSAASLFGPSLALARDALVASMRELEPLALAFDRRVTGMVALSIASELIRQQ